ncbi:lipopolysaccharide kinase InaA family protein [Puniceicoccaceae bacterium K14]|nr:lipopolysaccharide kinase InaA family protein [Puniceicoccaceae bacterium K14]
MRLTSFLNPSLTDDSWRGLVENIDKIRSGLTPNALLQGGRNDVYKIEHEGKQLVLKCFYNRGAWKKVAYKLSTSKARRSYLHSQKLINIGINSPSPIFWREDWDGAWLQNSYYVSEFLDYAHDGRSFNDSSIEDKTFKIRLAAETIACMHEAEIEHLDLNPANFLFKQGIDRKWQIYIIDNNRMKVGPVSLKRGITPLLLMELKGEDLDLLIASYSKVRNVDTADCRNLYFNTLNRHNLKWRIKSKTRPWRRKIGL